MLDVGAEARASAVVDEVSASVMQAPPEARDVAFDGAELCTGLYGPQIRRANLSLAKTFVGSLASMVEKLELLPAQVDRGCR
jgi:hypothetical protein